MFASISGQIFFKQQSYISGLGDLTPIIWFPVNEDNFWQVRWKSMVTS